MNICLGKIYILVFDITSSQTQAVYTIHHLDEWMIQYHHQE